MLAAPSFLGHRPTILPIPEACSAIIGRACRPATLIGATLAMMCATPSLFTDRPSCLPIEVAVRTIVWIWSWRSCVRPWATQMMHSAAEFLLVWRPHGHRIDGAIRISWWCGRTWRWHWWTGGGDRRRWGAGLWLQRWRHWASNPVVGATISFLVWRPDHTSSAIVGRPRGAVGHTDPNQQWNQQ